MFNISIVLLAAQVNRKIGSDIEISGRRHQITHVYSRNKGYICVKMMAQVSVLLVWFSSFKYFKDWQEMFEFNTKITIAHLLSLTIVSAKSKIYSPRRRYLSPGNSIVLEITSALLFISVTNACRFWSSFCWNSSTLSTDLFMFVTYARAAGLLSPRPYTLTTRWHSVYCTYSALHKILKYTAKIEW